MERSFRRFVARLSAAGITSVGDALIGPQWWQLLEKLDATEGLGIRINALAAYGHVDYFRRLPDPTVSPESRLRLGGVKTVADGAVSGGTCLVEEPVIGGHGHGLERVPPSRLNEIVQEVHEAGWRVCVHANGDRAIRHVLDAIEQAQRAHPAPVVCACRGVRPRSRPNIDAPSGLGEVGRLSRMQRPTRSSLALGSTCVPASAVIGDGHDAAVPGW